MNLKLLLPLLIAPALVAQAPSVDEILNNHLKAIGGSTALKSQQTRRTALRMTGMAPFEIPVIVEQKRPGQVRREISIQGQLQISATNGKDCWKVDPFTTGNNAPLDMNSDEKKAILNEADIEGFLVNPVMKGHLISYAGSEMVDGRKVHKLQVIQKGGDTCVVMLDASTWLESRRIVTQTQMGQKVEIIADSSEYKAVNGIMFAHKIKMGPKGAPQTMGMTLDKVEINTPIGDSRFERPSGK